MTYTLIKYSSPGWRKHFGTLEEVYYELCSRICENCFELYGDSLDEILESCCGCEYGVEDSVEAPATVEEEIEEKLWQQDM